MPHIRSTVRKMSELARAAQATYPIRHLATEITRDVPSKSPTAELAALYRWVRDHIRYRYDPLDMEWVQAPHVTIEEGAGDCDDMSTLLAALSGALGHPWRFRTVGASPNVQEHVAMQAFDRKRWLTLDPVLEPPQPTTAPRTDVGTFALSAPGAEHLWNREGTMLSGPTSPADRTLWTFVPYYPPPVPPFGGEGPPMPGAWTEADTRYRSPDAPGFVNGIPLAEYYERGRSGGNYGSVGLGAPPRMKAAHRRGKVNVRAYKRGYPRLNGPTTAAERELWAWRPYDPAGLSGVGSVMLSFPVGAVRGTPNALGEVPFQHPHLGWGFLKKVGKFFKKAGHKIGVVARDVAKPLMKIEEVVRPIAKKIPIVKYFAMANEAIMKPLTKKVLGIKGGHLPNAQSLLDTAATAASAFAANVKLPNVSLPHVSLPHVSLPSLPHVSLPHVSLPSLPHVALPSFGTPAIAKQVSVALKSKYPSNATMMWDRGHGVYRVYVPTKGTSSSTLASLRKRGGRAAPLAGLGAFGPTLSFSLGAELRPSASVSAAKKALAAVQLFAKNHGGKPPAIGLPAVAAFQATDAKLKKDGGLYGTNVKAAIDYYLKTKAPSPAPALRDPLTWSPPSSPAPVHVVAPAKPAPARVVAAPKPVAKKPAAKPAPAHVVAAPAGMKPPPGYVEIGSEKESPGLAPTGYRGPAAKAPAKAPATKAPTPSRPSSSLTPVHQLPVSTMPDGPTGTLTPSTWASSVGPDGAPIIDAAPVPTTSLTPDGAPLLPGTPPPVFADGSQVAPSGTYDGVTYAPATGTYSSAPVPESKSSDDKLLWLALGYLYWRNRRAA